MEGSKPNLFIVGAAKSATTSLYYYLSQHPDIFMSDVKEPHYFSETKRKYNQNQHKIKEGEFHHTMVIKDKLVYLSMFKPGENKVYRGEASPSYLFDGNAAKNIFDFDPMSKIIIMLREPVSRAYSHYQMVYNLGFETENDFLKAVDKDQYNPDKIWGGAHLYVELGQYHKQLKRYTDLFPSDQVLVLKFEKFITDPIKHINEIFNFLSLDTNKVENLELEAKNTTNITISPLANTLLYAIKKNNLLTKIKAVIPRNLKAILKSMVYKNRQNNSENKRLTPGDRDFLNNKYFKADKEILKKDYGIFWD